MMVRVGMAVFGLLTLGMLILAVVSDRGMLEVHRKAGRLAEIEARIQELQTENTGLLDEIRTLRTDPAEIERRAREELRLVRPGEVILLIPSEEN